MKLYWIFAFLILGACGTEKHDHRDAPESGSPAQEQTAQVSYESIDAPKTVIARVPIQDLKSEDFGSAEFAPVNAQASSGAQLALAFENNRIDANELNGDFAFSKAGTVPVKGAQLCGGCGGGGSILGWVGGLLYGVGRIVGGVLYGAGAVVSAAVHGAANIAYGVGSVLVDYRPYFQGNAYGCGYSYKGSYDYQGYRYFQYDRDPGQFSPTQSPIPPVGKGGVIPPVGKGEIPVDPRTQYPAGPDPYGQPPVVNGPGPGQGPIIEPIPGTPGQRPVPGGQEPFEYPEPGPGGRPN